MKLLNPFFVCFFLLIGIAGFSQAPVNYNDVAVICNANDTGSLSLGKYFMKKRGIPSQNLIIFKNTSKEIIDSLTFEEIRKQIEDSIIGHGIQDKINYLVTTKGCPLKITRTDTCDAFKLSTLATIRCAAFDNELMLILGSSQKDIGKDSAIDPIKFTFKAHPYFRTFEHFSRKKHGIYLVSRLQAATQTEAFNLINRQGANTLVDKSTANFVFDDFPGSDSMISKRMKWACDMLRKRKWNVIQDTDYAFLQKQSNVLGYVSWGFTDPYKLTSRGFPNNTSYSNAAIGVSYYSFNGYTFADNNSARSTFPRIIREGISGYFATVYEPFTFTFPMPHQLYDLYTDSSQDVNYNIAESYFNASPSYSWMGMIIGDPKTSIVTHLPPKPDPYCDTISFYIIGKGSKQLYANNISRGHWGWFKGDSSSLKKLGIAYDDNHPLLYSKTKKLLISDTTFTVGKHYFTFVNQNISGTFYQQYEINVTKFTGISDVISNTSISIAPNPVTNRLNIYSSPTLNQRKVNVQLMDISGKVVFQESMILNTNNSLMLDNMVSGVYLLKITDGKSNFHQKLTKE